MVPDRVAAIGELAHLRPFQQTRGLGPGPELMQTAIGNWLDHSLFTARIPEFIALFEATANRKLRVRQQETGATITISGGSGTLPTDYLSWRRALHIGDLITELEYIHPSYFALLYPDQPDGIPRKFTIQGSTFSQGLTGGTGSTTLF